MRLYFSGLVVAGLVFAAVSPASATSASTCSDFTAANGTATFPGTNVGTVGMGAGQVCQIGNISANNVAGAPVTGTYVNNGHPTSIYSFSWGGGSLTIEEKLGNNGTGDAVDVTLDSLPFFGSPLFQFQLSLLPFGPPIIDPTIASVIIPFQPGPTSFVPLITNMYLAAGNYAIENQLVPGAEDPTFQINFAATSTPEPASLALVLGGLAGVTLLRRRHISRA